MDCILITAFRTTAPLRPYYLLTMLARRWLGACVDTETDSLEGDCTEGCALNIGQRLDSFGFS